MQHSTVPCETDFTQSMWCTTDREHGKLNHSDADVIDPSPVSKDDSPLIKKPRRQQEAQRPCYGLVRLRIARYESSAALEAASSGDLSTQFIADYPRYKGMPENVAAGYLLAHLAVRRALGILRREERDLFDGLPESSDWSFTWAPVKLEGQSQLIWQIAQAFSNWSPVLLDMDDIAQEDAGMSAERKRYDDADPIPYRRSQCQVMSQKTIHDCDKPQFPGDISVRDAYGQASLRGFFAQKAWQTRVAVVHTGTLGRSVSLQACWGENREVSSQNQLDSFLKSVASTFEKPRNADYSTKTSSILKGARGYVGRRFDVALETLEACYEEKISFADASTKVLKALKGSNYGEFLNSHYFFQLMLYSAAYVNHGPGKCPRMEYFAQWNFETLPLPKALVSKRNTLKFFEAMQGNSTAKPMQAKDLPEERISFRTVSGRATVDDGMEFVNTVLQRLQRIREQSATLEVSASVGKWNRRFTLDGHLLRCDNVLVQACMAEKIRQEQVDYP